MNKVAFVTVVLLSVFIGYQFVNKFDPESVRNKRVVITGGSQGIGEQIAYHYTALGANVIITARTKTNLERVIEKCRELGNEGNVYEYISLDLSEDNATEILVEFAEEKLGGIDILVLNHIYQAGLRPWGGTDRDYELISDVMFVNFYAYITAATNALPVLEKNSGSIIVVSSLAAKVPNPYMTSYSSSKHALEGFFGSLREEFIIENKDISITICTLGFIGTGSVKAVEGFGSNRLLSLVKPADPSSTARTIIEAGATRTKHLYYPWLETRVVTALYTFFPETVAAGFRFIWRSMGLKG